MTHRALTVLRAGLLGAALALAWSSPSFAQRPSELPGALAEALVDYLLAYSPGIEVTLESVEGDASFVTITNLFIQYPNGGGTMTFPEVTIEGSVLRDEGGFTADRLTFDNVVIEVEGEAIGGWATGYYEPAIVPSPEEALHVTAQPWLGFPESYVLRFEEISLMGGTVDYIESSGNWNAGLFTVAGFELPLAAFGDNPTIQAFSALGLTTIAADLSMAIMIDFAGERLSIDEATLSVASIGDLEMSVAISGTDLFAVLFSTEPPVPPKGKNPKAGALTPLTLTPTPDPFLDFFHLTFTDHGLLTLPGVGVAVEGRLTEIVGWLDDEALNEGLAAIDGLFGGKRRAIAISATPTEPVRFSEIGEAGESDPAEIAELLDLRITSGN